MDEKETTTPARIPCELEFQTPKIDKLLSALRKASANFEPIKKNRTGRGNNGKPYKYADLDALIEATKKHLLKQGVFLTQQLWADPVSGREYQYTSLLYEDQAIRSRSEITTEGSSQKNRWHAFGEASTYLRRYQASSILNVASEEDTDAQNVGGDAPTDNERVKASPATPKQVEKIYSMGSQLDMSQEEVRARIKDFVPECEGGDPNNLTVGKASEILSMIAASIRNATQQRNERRRNSAVAPPAQKKREQPSVKPKPVPAVAPVETFEDEPPADWGYDDPDPADEAPEYF